MKIKTWVIEYWVLFSLLSFLIGFGYTQDYNKLAATGAYMEMSAQDQAFDNHLGLIMFISSLPGVIYFFYTLIRDQFGKKGKL